MHNEHRLPKFNDNWPDEQKKAWRTQSRQYLEMWLDRVLYDPELTAGQKVTATAYTRFYNLEKREAWPSYAAVAERCGTSPETVRKHVGKLKEKGYLYYWGQKINGSGGYGSNRYRIGLPATEEDLDWLHGLKRKPHPEAVEGADSPDALEGEEDTYMTQPPEWGRYETTTPPVPGDHPPGTAIPGVRYQETANSLEVLPGKTQGREQEDLVSAHLTDEPTFPDFQGEGDLTSISHFIALEREHRDEFINYWIDALTRLDYFSCVTEQTSYTAVLAAFRYAFKETQRRDWIGTFKFFINATTNDADPDHHGGEMEDGFLYLQDFHDEDKKIRDGRTWQEFRDAFPSPPQRVDDREYRRIWERLLLEVEAPVIWAALTEEQYTAGKFPREFEEKLITTIRRTRGREKYRLMEKVSA